MNEMQGSAKDYANLVLLALMTVSQFALGSVIRTLISASSLRKPNSMSARTN
jgi:hypothetical protein